MQSSKRKFKFTGPNQILKIYFYIVLNKVLLVLGRRTGAHHEECTCSMPIYPLQRGFYLQNCRDFYMQGCKVREKTAIVPPVSKLSGCPDMCMQSFILLRWGGGTREGGFSLKGEDMQIKCYTCLYST